MSIIDVCDLAFFESYFCDDEGKISFSSERFRRALEARDAIIIDTKTGNTYPEYSFSEILDPILPPWNGYDLKDRLENNDDY